MHFEKGLKYDHLLYVKSSMAQYALNCLMYLALYFALTHC
jgi:hypothetical protein